MLIPIPNTIQLIQKIINNKKNCIFFSFIFILLYLISILFPQTAFARADAVYDDAADIYTDETGFSGNLSAADTTVQLALDTLDQAGGFIGGIVTGGNPYSVLTLDSSGNLQSPSTLTYNGTGLLTLSTATLSTATFNIDSTGSAELSFDRGTTSFSSYAIQSWRTAGVNYFSAGLYTTDNNFWQLSGQTAIMMGVHDYGTYGELNIIDNSFITMGNSGQVNYYQKFDGTYAQFYTPTAFIFNTGKILSGLSAPTANYWMDVKSTSSEQFVARFDSPSSSYAGFLVQSSHATGIPFIQLHNSINNKTWTTTLNTTDVLETRHGTANGTIYRQINATGDAYFPTSDAFKIGHTNTTRSVNLWVVDKGRTVVDPVNGCGMVIQSPEQFVAKYIGENASYAGFQAWATGSGAVPFIQLYNSANSDYYTLQMNTSGDLEIRNGTAVGTVVMTINNSNDTTFSAGDVDVSAGKVSYTSLTLSATGPTDNLDVSGVNVVFVDASSNAVTLGGLTGGVDGQVLHVVIVGVGAGNTVTFENQEGTGNQDMYLNGPYYLADIVIPASTYGGIHLVCNGTSWFEIDH